MIYLLLIATLIVFVGSHWMAYHFFINAVNIKKERTRLITRLVLIFLPFSFIGSSAIAHFWSNPMTQFLYFISGLWIGYIINLIVVTLVFLVVFLIMKLFKVSCNKRIIYIVALSLALLITIGGLINVFIFDVEVVDVKIEDLPDSWVDKKVVQISDLHLGAVLQESFLKKVVNEVNSLEPDMVVITGDLFDGVDGYTSSLVSLLNQIDSVHGVYYVTGNHETYLNLGQIIKSLDDSDVIVLNDEMVVIDDLQLIGLAQPERSEFKVISSEIVDSYDATLPSILLYHLPISFYENEYVDAEVLFNSDTNFQVAKDLGIDLQLSGHTHNGQIFPFNFITGLIYNNFDVGLSRSDDFQIYVNRGTGVWGPTIRTSSRPEITLINLK